MASKGKTPGATRMAGGQNADRQRPVNAEMASVTAGRAAVAGFNAAQRADYNAQVMSVPDVTKGAPGPKAMATGLNPGGAPRGRGAGAFKGFLGDD